MDIYLREISKLKEWCDEQKIDYEICKTSGGYKMQFMFGRYPDVICHEYSYGGNEGLLESMGFKEDKGEVTGWLTAEDIKERLLNCNNECNAKL